MNINIQPDPRTDECLCELHRQDVSDPFWWQHKGQDRNVQYLVLTKSGTWFCATPHDGPGIKGEPRGWEYGEGSYAGDALGESSVVAVFSLPEIPEAPT